MGFLANLSSHPSYGGATTLVPLDAPTGSTAPLMPIPQTQGQWNTVLGGLFGQPGERNDSTHDRAVSDIYNGPYRGPLDLDRYGGETPEARRQYREQFSQSPIFRAAIKGKANDIAALEPTVHVLDKNDAEANDAAEFLKWTVSMAPGGWPGAILSTYLPGSLDGWSVLEKKREPQIWKGRTVWGLAHLRPLDTVHFRLTLDVYRNVTGVVNMVRGLESYQPDGYILYTHNGLYNNPFGQSDGRAAIEAARDISDVYKLWYIALKVYGLPYMVGKTTEQNRRLMDNALKVLRGGGYAVLTNEKDTIELLNMAVGAALNGFESYVNQKRQDIFYGVRGAALPFLEGKGGNDAHGNSKIEQGTSDAGEKMDAHKIADVFNRQLVPWLLAPNYHLEPYRMPQIKLGGTDWEQTAKIIAVIKDAQDIGMEPSAEWARDVASVQMARGPDDRLVSAQERQQKEQQQQQMQAQQAQQQAAAPPQVAGGPPAGPAPPPQPSADQPLVLPAKGAGPTATFSAPGPPPRPGLQWKEETHRWIHPQTGEEHPHEPSVPKPAPVSSPAVAKVQAALPSTEELKQIVTSALDPAKLPAHAQWKAKAARTGRWEALCDTIAPIVRDELAKRGVKARVVEGTYRVDNGPMGVDGHVWLETPEGVVIDPAACQYHAGVAVGQTIIYPTRPGWYHEGAESATPKEAAPESLNAPPKTHSASTFSADHVPRPDGVSAEQMARVMGELLQELAP